MTRNPGAPRITAALALVFVVGVACNREQPSGASGNAPPAAGTPPAAGAPAAGAAGQPHVGDYHISPQGVDRIKQSEAFIPKVYDDGVGNETIGYGHMLDPGESFPRPITEPQARDLLAKDLAKTVEPVLQRITVQLTQNQIDALGSFIFNVGEGNFVRSVLPHLNRRDTGSVFSHMFQYIKGKNQRTGERVTLRGLLKRRQEEVALFKQGAGLALDEWSRAARRLLASGMQFLRSGSACLLDSCRSSRSFS